MTDPQEDGMGQGLDDRPDDVVRLVRVSPDDESGIEGVVDPAFLIRHALLDHVVIWFASDSAIQMTGAEQPAPGSGLPRYAAMVLVCTTCGEGRIGWVAAQDREPLLVMGVKPDVLAAARKEDRA